ncbi:hypothetical protein HNP37_000309 [Flavobacterium nitrogenifigens]|uniref:Uncharacterized protein n=2 Tax=Flavobacterium TaxID=237 RepID=A0A7W7N531_9FLAO|nr:MULTISPECIES: hypothetical protein [Flavobacterium]MBB4800270.1 hypothetical protein [Flavobacterium nitrogenifigens]MBB6385980.1 hypothetical protein [Flavobacterium notoginsengisoli]
MSIFWGIIGGAFFGWIIFLLYNSRSKGLRATTTVDLKTAEVLYYTFFTILIFFCLWSLSLALKMKIVILTSSNLIIKYPFFFLKKTICLGDIDKILEKDYKVKPNVNGTVYNVHEGKEAVIQLFSGKKVKINSFEIYEYKDLMRKLYIAKSRYKYLNL